MTTYSTVLESAAESGHIRHVTDLLSRADEGGIELDAELIGRVLEKLVEVEPASAFDDVFRKAGGISDHYNRHFGAGAYQRKFGDVFGSGGSDHRWSQVSDYEGDPYAVLGVSKDASSKEIKTAFRSLIKKYHPDKNPGDIAAAEKAKELISAYEYLGKQGKVN